MSEKAIERNGRTAADTLLDKEDIKMEHTASHHPGTLEGPGRQTEQAPRPDRTAGAGPAPGPTLARFIASPLYRFTASTRGNMVESALTLPLMLLVTLALVNLALAAFASNTATNAAHHAARVAAVAQVDAPGRGLRAAEAVLAQAPGSYQTQVQADSYSGGQVRVRVRWQVPNVFGGLMPFFGQPNRPLQGDAWAQQRKEGW